MSIEAKTEHVFYLTKDQVKGIDINLETVKIRYPLSNAAPFYKEGDSVKVLEPFCVHDEGFDPNKINYTQEEIERFQESLYYFSGHDCTEWEGECPCHNSEWAPAEKMPDWARRTFGWVIYEAEIQGQEVVLELGYGGPGCGSNEDEEVAQ